MKNALPCSETRCSGAARGQGCAFDEMDWSHRATGPLWTGTFSATDYPKNTVLMQQRPAASDPDRQNTLVIPVLGLHGLFAIGRMAEGQ